MYTDSLYQLEATVDYVRFWSNKRLPFEPTGSMLDGRNEIRQALSALKPCSRRILNARYQSTAEGFCDVENVLFYNVGAAAFRSVVRNGLRFERLHTKPPISSHGTYFDHHHEYCLIDAPPVPAVHPKCVLAFEVPSLTSDTKPHTIWWQASSASVLSASKIAKTFEMHVTLELPTPVINLASIIKPLLDGIISALHVDSAPNLEAVNRLARKTGRTTEEILLRLTAPAAPILGPRHVLHAYRNFVKWNPADDLCEACTVLIQPSISKRCVVELLER